MKISEFDLLCQTCERMTPAAYGLLLGEKMATVTKFLSTVTQNEMGGNLLLGTFILGAVAADDKGDRTEFHLISPFLSYLFGGDVPFDYSLFSRLVKALRTDSRRLKRTADEMVDLITPLPETLKTDIITVALMICAVDGHISLAEKNWIRMLIR